MKDVRLNLLPGGKTKALTLSYDDGTFQDQRLIQIMNDNKLKGTFHINSGLFGQGERLPEGEIKETYQGHEISLHAVTHPFLDHIPRNAVINEIWEDRKALEEIAGYPVRGMSFPYGTHNESVNTILKELDIIYARSVTASHKFTVPETFLPWHPTCHHRDNLLEKGEEFRRLNYTTHRPYVFYVWGHSYEFDRNDNWDLIETFCAEMAGLEDTWYATNIEIYDYLTAVNRLEFSADCSLVKNPNSLAVWISVDGQPIRVESGELKQL